MDFISDQELDEILHSINTLLGEPEEKQTELRPLEMNYSGYTEQELEELGFGDAQIDEIETGVRQQLPVWRYARPCYNWQQMQEIRLGLLEGLDVSVYENHLFAAEQMHEIRMGLMDHLDVSSYANLVLSTGDMAAMRKNLLTEDYQEHPDGHAREMTDEDSGVRIRISDDCMHAYLTLAGDRSFSAHELEKILNRNGIVYGIHKEWLMDAASGRAGADEFPAAEGIPATKGKDGEYEYYFNPLLPEEPRIKEDGGVDYTHIIVADKRKAGDTLAKYYPEERGKDGQTVTGITIKGIWGEKKQPLHGEGIRRDEKNNLYLAAISGFVVLDEQENTLNVYNVYEVDGDVNRYNGHIRYNGIIHVKGSVSEMAVIEATGNVVVDGYVEAAHIRAGENIILRGGMNGCGSGVLEAGGRVVGTFFESASIHAGGDVEGNYFLNCEVVTDKSLLAKGRKSRIIGGTVKAGYSVEANDIMAAGRQAASVIAGDPVWIGQRQAETDKRLAQVREEIKQLEDGKKRLGSMFDSESAEQNALFHKVCVAIRTKEEQENRLQVEHSYCEGMRQRAQKAFIKVPGAIQPGTTVSVRGKTRHLDQALHGKITFEKE